MTFEVSQNKLINLINFYKSLIAIDGQCTIFYIDKLILIHDMCDF